MDSVSKVDNPANVAQYAEAQTGQPPTRAERAPTPQPRGDVRFDALRPRRNSAAVESASSSDNAEITEAASRLLISHSAPVGPAFGAEYAAATLQHYNAHAVSFRDGTRSHDVSENISALLRHIEVKPPFSILDFGCGPGRDLKTFSASDHHAVGLDGSKCFVEMARDDTACDVWLQDFLELDLPNERFDGIFANASLFHVLTQELPRVLRQLNATLKPGGVLFSSNPRGTNQEGWDGGRYGAFYDLETWSQYMTNAGFDELEHYYRPAGLPREQQPWLASVWRKRAA